MIKCQMLYVLCFKFYQFMLLKLLNGEIKNINWASLTLAFFTLISALFGLLRNNMLASHFGAGDELDIYYTAFRIPDLIFNLLFFGAISAGFLPLFSKEFNKNKEKSWELVNNLINAIILIMIVFTGILFILMPKIVPLTAPGFSQTKLQLAIILSRIMLIQPILLGISSIFSGIVQSFHKFLTYSLAPILYNIGIITGIIFLSPKYGIFGVGYGVILGAALHFLIQLPAVLESGFRYKFILNLKSESLSQMFKISVPRSLDLFIGQLSLIAVNIFASFLVVGSLAIFNFSRDLLNFTVGIFGISFATASFPIFTRLANENNIEELKKLLNKIILKILFFLIPISGFFIVFKAQIVQLILGYGNFNLEDTLLTIKTLNFLSLSLIGLSLLPLFLRVFFSFSDSKTPLYVSFIAFVFSIFLMFIFTKYFGVAGLALAITVSSFFEIVLLMIILEKRIKWLVLKEFIGSLALIIIKSVISLILGFFSLKLMLLFITHETIINLIIQTTVSVSITSIIYLLLNYSEIKEIFNSLKNHKV